MLSTDFISLLSGLGLTNNPSLFFLNKDGDDQFSFKSKEIKNRLEIIKPTAFYVFNGQPLILFFDLIDTPQREKEIHKQAWSFDQSPVIFIVKAGEVKVFNAFAYNKKKEQLEEIKSSPKGIFSFWNLQSGNTWRWLQSEYYENKNIQKKRVNQKLFENIKAVREGLLGSSDRIDEDDANILILRLIFIRYLIDRGVRLNKDFIAGETILEKKKSFIDLIEKPKKLNACFEWLNEKFNGVLFKDIKVQISKEVAIELAKVFDGERQEKNSLFYDTELYFEIFDFSIIPVELISGIYEALIDEDTRKLHSAVYTPLFLVEYVLTHTIDNFFSTKKNKRTSECKVFDPSVGSGIFLVQTFRRMVDRELYLNGRISKVRLKEIVKNNLFGIDINRQALKVTCFSIYIAMLDYQEPATITDNFKFPELIDTNLFEADFFDTKANYNDIITNKGIDFILGNPPWKSSKGAFHLKWLKEAKKITGRFEIAQSFLLRIKDFMQPKTTAALIVTSTIFYNISNTTKIFKQDFLSQYCVKTLFDLSPVRRMVFEEKDNPCIIVIYKLSNADEYLNNIVRHISVKSNLFLKYFRQLVVEKFDIKEIQQKHFIENDWMFKVALYGNVLDFAFLKRLEDYSEKIIDLIDNKSIFKGDGILKGSPKKKPFDFLVGLPLIENSQVKYGYTNVDNTTPKMKLEDTYLESGRKTELFEGQHIYLKAQTVDESEICVSYNDKTAVHKHDVIAITSKTKTNILKVLFSIFISDFFTYFQYMRSSAWGVATRPAIRLEEYLSFPYLKLSNENEEKLLTHFDEFINPYKNFYSQEFQLGEPEKNTTALGKINSVIFKTHQINTYEKDLINYVLDVSRYQFQESKIERVTRKVHKDNEVLEKYIGVFIEELSKVYKNEYLQVNIYALDYFIAMNFTLTKDTPTQAIIFNDTETDEKAIFKALSDNISISKVSKDLYTQKDIKGFEENSFYVIKPNEYKCWHRAMAWYDIAEIKKTIEDAEIDYLKEKAYDK